MRTYNLSTQRIAQMLGAEPVDVPMVEVNQALAGGRIDSMITSADQRPGKDAYDRYAELRAQFDGYAAELDRLAPNTQF